MSDLAETLWREFAVETEEHFEILEPLLAGAATEQVVAADVAQLFRSFHSVKGLSRSMDMRGMEKVAHLSENVLGLVRDGDAQLDCAVVNLLLRGVDALKELRLSAVHDRADAPAPEDLVTDLEATYAALLAARPQAGAPPTPVAPNPAPSPAPAPVVVEAAPAATTAPALHQDADLLRFFAEVVKDNLPAIAQAASSQIEDAATRTQALEAVDTMLNACDVMGFEGLLGNFQTLNRLLAPDAQLGADERQAIAGLLGDIRGQLATIEQETQFDVGGKALARRLYDALEGEIRFLLSGIAEVLQAFGKTDSASAAGSDQMLAEDVAASARTLYSFLLFLESQNAGQAVLMLEDVFSRVASGEIILYPELLALANDTIGAIVHMLGDPVVPQDIPRETLTSLLGQFRKALVTCSDGARGNDPSASLKRVLADYEISNELIEILSPDNIADLVAVARGGKEYLYEILAHLESSETMTLAFVKWLREEAHPITNRTVFVNGATWFEFLVASSHSEAAVVERIGLLDPSGENVRVRACKARPAAGAATESRPVVSERRAPAPAAATAAGEPRAQARGGAGSGVLRVRSESIDYMMAQIGELVTVSNMMRMAVGDEEAVTALKGLRDLAVHDKQGGILPLVTAVERSLDRLRQVSHQLATVLGYLQDSTLDLRVVSIDTVFNRFPRLVHDLGQAKGKQVRLEVSGGEVRIDKGMVDTLIDPLMHMIRNAVDHGLEIPAEREAAGKAPLGRIQLSAESRANRVVIRITDDGRGLDSEKIRRKAVEKGLMTDADSRRLDESQLYNLIFAPGFSTADTVSDTSGRGVGMDVALTNVLRLGGEINVSSHLGHGSVFSIELPLSAAIQDVLVVSAGGQDFAIPDRFVAEVHQAAPEDFQSVKGQRAILLRGRFLPIFTLGALLGRPGAGADSERAGARAVVVLATDRRTIGIEVDALKQRQELFIKEICAEVAAIPGIGGASVTGDGKVMLILDGEDLFRLAALASNKTGASTKMGAKGGAKPGEGLRVVA